MVERSVAMIMASWATPVIDVPVVQLASFVASRATGVTDALHSDSRVEVVEEDHSKLHQEEEV